MKDWKALAKKMVINAASAANDLVDFTHTVKTVYELTSEDLKELGFEYALEIRTNNNISIHLFSSKDEAVERLKTTFKIFELSYKVTDSYIRDDDMFAYQYTDDDDVYYDAEIEKL
jgi:hypothetical protein